MKTKRQTTLCLVVILCCFSFLNSGASIAKEKTPTSAKTKKADKPLRDAISETSHTLTISGKRLDYIAKAGRIVVKPEGLQKKGLFFFVSYELKTDKPESRPLTFAFNGGPGAASVWLHMGALGPRRVKLNADGSPPPPPGSIEDNPDTWLKFTDLVFIDPIGTGYSRAVPDTTHSRREFYAVKPDVESVAEFIRLYLVRYQRWLSPKYIVGESYGGTRAVVLSVYLHDTYGISLNGLLLISPALDFTTLLFKPHIDLPYLTYLPSYAAAAWYHHRLSDHYQGMSFDRFRKKVEGFTMTQYWSALAQGDLLTERQKEDLAGRLAGYTGINKKWILRNRFRIDAESFRKRLLREKGMLIGRIDSSISGADPDPANPFPSYDPAMDGLSDVFSSAINAYLRTELQFTSDLTYQFLNKEANSNWNWAKSLRGGQGYLDVSDSLRQIMSINPYLRVFIGCGYYDLSTPYFATQYVVNHLALNDEQKSRLQIRCYHAGHMLYTHAPVLKRMSRDVEVFYHAIQPDQ